jgi:hypothetical protein
MDPQACLNRIGDASDATERRDACRDLAAWIARGGFVPDWTKNKRAARLYRAWCAGGTRS